MCTDTSDKEGLPKDNRPGLIPVMRSDHPGVPKNTSWGILFLRLEGTHLHSQGGVFGSDHYTLMCVQATLFRASRDRKSLLEVLKRLSPCDDLLCDPVLRGDGDSIGSVLSPHISLIETVKLRNKEGGNLLMLRCTILGVAPRTSPQPWKSGKSRGGALSLQSYLTRGSLWMSRRSTTGGDDHEDASLRSSLSSHKACCSSIKRKILSNIIKHHTYY
jgi:hypothetical protein